MSDLPKGVTARLTPELYHVPDLAAAESLDRMLRRLEDASMESTFSGLEIGRSPQDETHVSDLKPEEQDFLREGGWMIERGTAHRGVLHEDEYVAPETMQSLVEEGLGFTYEQIRSVYRSGPLSAQQSQLRSSIDARLLALSRSGGNMLVLAKALGWAVEPGVNGGGDSCRTMERALARARAAA